MLLPEPLWPTTASVWPAGISKLDVLQNLPVRFIGEVDLLEADGARTGIAVAGHLGILISRFCRSRPNMRSISVSDWRISR